MKEFKMLTLLAIVFQITIGCKGQQNPEVSSLSKNSKKVGGGCDGCDEMYIGMPENMTAADTSLGWYDKAKSLYLQEQF